MQDDLIEALKAYENNEPSALGKSRPDLSGAALDVAVPEHLPRNHPLWDAPNCIITPHICGINRDYGTLAFEVLEINPQRMAEGKTPLNLVNRETGYTSAGRNL